MASSYSRQQERNAVDPHDVWIFSSKGVLFLALIIITGLLFHHLIGELQLHKKPELQFGETLSLVSFFCGITANVLAAILALMYLFKGYLLVYEEVLLWLLVAFIFCLLGSGFLDLLNHPALAGIAEILYSTVFPLSGIIGVGALLYFWKSEL